MAKDHTAHGIGGGNAQTVNGDKVGVHDVLATLSLPPLTLAIVLLEEALVVRDTVLAEHESSHAGNSAEHLDGM